MFRYRKLAAEFVSWWRSTRKQFLFYTGADKPEDGLSTGRNM